MFRFTLCAILILILTWGSLQAEESLPVVHFNGQIALQSDTADKLVGIHKYYVLYKENGPIPPIVNNKEAKTAAVDCYFYNHSVSAQEAPFSLKNPRFIEALLAEGYSLQTYFWLLGKEEKPWRGMSCTIIGYNRYKKQFICRFKDGRETRFSYDDVTNNFRFAELAENQDTRRWHFTEIREENKIRSLKVEAPGFENAVNNALSTTKEYNPDEVQFIAHLMPKGLRGDEKLISIPFSMEIKKKKLSSKGCGGFIWWPVGAKSFDVTRWDEEKYGVFVSFEPSKPVDYPNSKSKNYVHNKHWQCHPCGHSKMIPGVWINYRYDGSTISTKIVKYSTCNIGSANWDKYGNATAIVAGVMNCWVIK